MEQPLKIGDIWFFLPQPWFDDWKQVCEAYPDDFDTKVDIITSVPLTGGWCYNRLLKNPEVGKISVPDTAWYELVNW